MTTLPTTFRHDGFDFRQLKREGDVAMFEKTKPHHTVKHYEVVIVQKRSDRSFPDGRLAPAHEAMPSSEQWGTYGWTPYDLEAAERRWVPLG